MQNLFTFIAAKYVNVKPVLVLLKLHRARSAQHHAGHGVRRIILAQLEGSGRGNLASYNASAYQDLTSFLEANPLRDSEAWLGALLKKNEMLGELTGDQCYGCPTLPVGHAATPHDMTCRVAGHGGSACICEHRFRMGEHKDAVLEGSVGQESSDPPAACRGGVHTGNASRQRARPGFR